MILPLIYLIIGVLVAIIDANIRFECDIKTIEKTNEMSQFMPSSYLTFAKCVARIIGITFWPLTIVAWIYKLLTSHLLPPG